MALGSVAGKSLRYSNDRTVETRSWRAGRGVARARRRLSAIAGRSLRPRATIGIEGFRELVSWVAEGTTPESRHARGSTVRQVIDDIVKNVDSAKINQALLDEAARLSKEAPQ